MKFSHPQLGNCELLISFEGKKNQLHLVEIEEMKTPGSRNDGWLLWGPLDFPIERLGKTHMTPEEENYERGIAIETFMQATQTLDQMEFVCLAD